MQQLKIARHKVWMNVVKVITTLMPVPQPTALVGPDSSLRLCRLIEGSGHKKVLIVTDKDLEKLGLHEKCQSALQSLGLSTAVYSNISPNPTVQQMEAGITAAKDYGAECILAIGGGSPMDSAKVIAAGFSNALTIAEMEGVMKIKQAPLPIYAIPTTAGTGSEVTTAAVVTNTEQQRKYTVADHKLVPQAVCLDPLLMLGLPPHVTAATGIDALTHAIEAYVATSATDDVRNHGLLAIKLIFKHLETACQQGSDVEAREAMAVASYHAGIAIARCGVGYVHAIAHQLGGIYHVPHGLANAVLLPHVLAFSKDSIQADLATFAIAIGVGEAGEPNAVLADKFLAALDQLISHVQLPRTLPEIQESDMPLIVDRAIQEAFDFFAVPKYMEKKDGLAILRKIAVA